MATLSAWIMGAALVGAALPSTAAAPALACTATAHTKASGHWIRFQLRNMGSEPVWLLRWGSPFEGGWWAPFVTVTHHDQPLVYQGAQMKRGEPERSDYFRLAPGQTRTAQVRLEDAYTLKGSGPWHLKAQWTWHDAWVGKAARAPRPRDQHQALAQSCGEWTLP